MKTTQITRGCEIKIVVDFNTFNFVSHKTATLDDADDRKESSAKLMAQCAKECGQEIVDSKDDILKTCALAHQYDMEAKRAKNFHVGAKPGEKK